MILPFPAEPAARRQALAGDPDAPLAGTKRRYIAPHKNVKIDIAVHYDGQPRAFLNRLAIALP
jgi:hypothetical protein